MRRVAFAVACVLAYSLAARHHHDRCRSSWFSFLEDSVYCSVLERGVRALQVAPLVALAPLLPAIGVPPPRLPR